MTESARDNTVDFGELIRRVARRGGLVIAVTFAATITMLAVGSLVPKEYTASATLTVSPISLDPLASSSAAQINISTEREVLGSTEVARIAADQLGGDVEPESLRRNSSVAAPSGSQVLQVSVTAPDAEDAADYANAMANAYLSFRGDGAAQLAQTRIAEVDTRITEAEADGNAALLADLRSERVALDQVSQNTGRIIGIAQAPRSASSLGLPVYLVAGLVGGLLLGAALALLRDHLDRNIRSAERLSERTGLNSYLVRGTADEEAFRWLLRAIRNPYVPQSSRPVVVSVFTLGPANPTALIEGLRVLAANIGLEVVMIDQKRLPGAALDRSWTFQPARGSAPQLVLIDGRHVTSGARQATLADASDVVLVTAAERSRIADLHLLLASLGESDFDALLPVFISAKTHKGASTPIAPARSALNRRFKANDESRKPEVVSADDGVAVGV